MPCMGPSREEVIVADYHGKLYQLVLDLNDKFIINQRYTFSKAFITRTEQELYNTKQAYNTQIFFHECTRMLCDIVKSFTENEKEMYLYNGRDPLCVRLAYWWNTHEEEDRRRGN